MLKYDLYAEMARNLNELLGDFTATGGSLNSIVSTDMPFPITDQVRGAEAFIYTGGGAGQTRVVASFSASGNAAHVVPTLTTAPSTNSKFLLFERFRTTDFRSAVDRAMGAARLRYFTPYLANITLIASQYEYTVPSGMDFVAYLQLVPTTGTYFKDTEEMNYNFVFQQGSYRVESNKIIFDPRVTNLDDYDKKYARVVGQTRPAPLGTDNATVPSMIEEYLIAKGTAIMAAKRVTKSSEWAALFKFYTEMADGLEKYITSQARGDEVIA